MSQSFVGNRVPVSELVLRGEALVSGPGASPGRSASEFVQYRVSLSSAFVSAATPKRALPAVFDELRRKASRMKFQRIGAKAPDRIASSLRRSS